MDYKELYIQFLKDLTKEINRLTKLRDDAVKELIRLKSKSNEKNEKQQSEANCVNDIFGI